MRVLEPVALRELALHRVVVHHDDARVVRRRLRRTRRARARSATRRRSPMIEMSRRFHVSVAQRDALRRVEADERRARHAQHRLEVLADVAPVRSRRSCPRSPMPSGARHHATSWLPGTQMTLLDRSRVADEGARALELARRARAARRRPRWRRRRTGAPGSAPRSPRYCSGTAGVPEVQIGDVKSEIASRSRGGRSRQQLRDDGVGELRRCVAVPPRSRVTRLPFADRRLERVADRAARARCRPMCSSIRQAARISAPGLAIALPRDVGRRAVHRLEDRARPRRCSRPARARARRRGRRSGRRGCRRRGSSSRSRRTARACITSFIAIASTMRSSNSMRPSYSLRDHAADVEEEALRVLEDVRLVDERDLLAAVRDRVLERVADDALRARSA